MIVIERNTEEAEIQTIVEVVLACDHSLDHEYDNHPETVIDITNMVTSILESCQEVHLGSIREMAASYLQGEAFTPE